MSHPFFDSAPVPRTERTCLATGICRTPKLVVAKQHISSASLEGPYWWKMNFPPLESITEVYVLHSLCGTPMCFYFSELC